MGPRFFGSGFEGLESRMEEAGISGMWLCCSCDTGKPVSVQQHKRIYENKRIIDNSPWSYHNSSPELKCTSNNCGHRKCDECDFFKFIDQPNEGLEIHRGLNLRGGLIALRLSSKNRHFKCDIPNHSQGNNTRSPQQNGTEQDPQSSSTVVAFPAFRQYKKRENYNFWSHEDSEASDSEINAPTAAPKIPRAGQTNAATLQSHIPPTTWQPMPFWWNEVPIPDYTPPAQNKDTPATETRAPISNYNSAQLNNKISTNYVSPGLGGQITQTSTGRLLAENLAISGQGSVHISNTYVDARSRTPRRDSAQTCQPKSAGYQEIFRSDGSTPSFKPASDSNCMALPSTCSLTQGAIIKAEEKPPTYQRHDTQVNEGYIFTSAQSYRPQTSLSGLVKQEVDPTSSLSTTGPTRTVLKKERFSPYSSSIKHESTKSVSSSMRVPESKSGCEKRSYIRHKVSNASSTFPGPTNLPASLSPIPSAPPPQTPAAATQPSQVIDPHLEITRRPYSSSIGLQPSTPLAQEWLPKLGEPSSSTPARLPLKRPASPALRPYKIKYRQ
ncbi:hypothetical protein NHQ30_001837 [Ciborinia camelliae]|nr:hypothetical protein NHQ30_001837 [Ciborinia camelliae]